MKEESKLVVTVKFIRKRMGKISFTEMDILISQELLNML